MEIWDKSESIDLIIYKFEFGSMTYLAEVEISRKKLLILRDYVRYMSDLPEDKLLIGEYKYNVAVKHLRELNLIS